MTREEYNRYLNIAKICKEARIGLDISRQEMACMCKTSRQNIFKFEEGNNAIPNLQLIISYRNNIGSYNKLEEHINKYLKTI